MAENQKDVEIESGKKIKTLDFSGMRININYIICKIFQ